MGKSLVALRSDLLAACSAFLVDVGQIMDVPHADPRLALLDASLERFRRQASLKFDLPLAEMAAAAVDIRNFMKARLQELSSSSQLPDLIGETATLMDQHHSRVWELVQNPDLGLSDVYSRVLVGLLARQPIEADLFPGILEGLAGNLGLSPAGTVDPPRSRQEGVMRRWATTLRQAASDPSDTGQDPPQARLPGAPPRLQHGVPVAKSRRHPISIDVVAIAELPLFGEAQDQGTSVTSCSSTARGN